MTPKKLLGKAAKKLSDFSEFPSECTGMVPVAEIKGSVEAYVFGCSRILFYSKEKIVFDCLGFVYSIYGNGLCMNGFSDSRIGISGKIKSLEINSENI